MDFCWQRNTTIYCEYMFIRVFWHLFVLLWHFIGFYDICLCANSAKVLCTHTHTHCTKNATQKKLTKTYAIRSLIVFGLGQFQRVHLVGVMPSRVFLFPLKWTWRIYCIVSILCIEIMLVYAQFVGLHSRQRFGDFLLIEINPNRSFEMFHGWDEWTLVEAPKTAYP